MVYKFPELTRAEIEAMFTISDLKQTKVYQEALDEGRAEGQAKGRSSEALSLVIRQLNKRFGQLTPESERCVRSLSLEQIERLSDSLLDFCDRGDLDAWLEQVQ